MHATCFKNWTQGGPERSFQDGAAAGERERIFWVDQQLELRPLADFVGPKRIFLGRTRTLKTGSSNVIDERITLQTNSQGYPILARCGDSAIEVLISEDSGTGGTDVDIIGDEAALRQLGEILIGVSKAKGFHIHVESNAETSPLGIEPRNVRLTVSNKEMPPQAKASSPPPDWAKG
jgi:hypothetical protein